MARAGQVLASSTDKDLVLGSELSFSEDGERSLTGVPETRRPSSVEG